MLKPAYRSPKKSRIETCAVCGLEKRVTDMVACDLVRSSIAEELDTSVPRWRSTGWICREDLAEYRRRSVEAMIRREHGELTSLDREVVESLADHETVTENTEESYEEATTVGDRIADHTSAFVGSWVFIIGFVGFMLLWMSFNLVTTSLATFDPYPFILLNLLLSMIAALQAPLIMMSQRRQEAKDRLRSQNDYQINLKAELEIRHLHEKVDHVLIVQWERLSKIQEVQLELFEELSKAPGRH